MSKILSFDHSHIQESHQLFIGLSGSDPLDFIQHLKALIQTLEDGRKPIQGAQLHSRMNFEVKTPFWNNCIC